MLLIQTHTERIATCAKASPVLFYNIVTPSVFENIVTTLPSHDGVLIEL